MELRHLVVVPLLVLTGCGEASYLSYQGRPAETALECKAAYEEAQNRPDYSVPTTSAELIGVAIGRGLVEGALNAAYEQCLARVSALPAPVGGTTSVPPRQSASRPVGIGSGCISGGSPLQGGTGYC